jgi:neutral ceramidase
MRRGLIAVAFVAVLWAAPDAVALQAGAGRSDVTPPTGFYTMGYVRSDAVARGQHTRLYARALVLEQGGRKLALVATDLGFTPGGMTVEVGKRIAARGFDERNIVISASHTHSGPAGSAAIRHSTGAGRACASVASRAARVARLPPSRRSASRS